MIIINKNNRQPTYKRQRFLLDFIRQLQDGVTSTELQKLVFLHTMSETSNCYEFIPYRYGPYSFQLAEDLDILRRDGYLSAENVRIKAIGNYQCESLFQIATERGDNLIRKAYREYPYFTINSEITKRLFHGAELERFIQGQKRYVKSNQVLFTIGYEGKSIEKFINTLIQNDVKLLCDVRKNPLSRKFGFSKGKLEHITGTIGIKYVHVPELGIESDKRSSLKTDEDYKHLFDEYAKKLPALASLIGQVFSLLSSNIRIALMCYEQEPAMCHRHIIRDCIVGAHKTRSVDL